MEMLVVALASLLAGFVDSIVGGGGLVLVPALFATFPNAHPATLFGTNKGASVWGTAMATMQYSKRVQMRWHALLPVENIRRVVELIVGRPDLPPQIDAGVIDDLPEAPGAYALFGEAAKPLLVKRSTNLRQQVLAHFAPAKRDTALIRDIRRIEWRESAGELGARLAELEFSAATRKPIDDLCAWQLVAHDTGDYRPRLVYARDVDFAATPECFGLYMGAKEATQALRKLAEAHRLCHSQLGLGTAKSGEPCVAFKQKLCRGACVGKEPLNLHSARLMAALAKFRLAPWPYDGPVALIESDEFGMRKDFHVFDRWRYLGSAHNEASLHELLERRNDAGFNPDLYRLFNKFLRAGKLRVLALPASQSLGEFDNDRLA